MSTTALSGRAYAFADTYEDVQEFLETQVKYFARKYNVDITEVMGVANECFVESYHSCTPGKSFLRWLSYRLKRKLFDVFVRYPAFRNARLRRVDTEYEPASGSGFKLIDMTDGLSADALTLVKTALDMPFDVFAECPVDKVTPGSVRDGMFRYFGDLGWDVDRYRKAFKEVREALTN